MLKSHMSGWLMMTTRYAPFIHTGARNRGHKSIDQAHPATFGLWGCLDGVLSVTIAGHPGPLRLHGPVAVFITPGAHQVVSASGGSTWYHLRFDVLTQPRERIPGRQAWRHVGPVDQPDPEAIWGCRPPTVVPDFLCASTIQLLRDANAMWWRNDHFHAQANASLGHWLMDYVVFARSGAEMTATGSGLHQRCRELIHERLSLGADVADLAAACGYSRGHFIRHFRTETGMRPGRFIREERMAHACHLLASTDATLQEVAEQCGYRSVSAFSRAFAEVYGRAPGSWRRRFR